MLSKSRNGVNIQDGHVDWLYTLPNRHRMALGSCWLQGHLAPRLRWLGLHLHFLRNRTFEAQTFHLKSRTAMSVILSKSCNRVNSQHGHVRLYTLPSRHWMALESCWRQGHPAPRLRWLGLHLHFLLRRTFEAQTFHLKSRMETSVVLSKSSNQVNIQRGHVQRLYTLPSRHGMAVESCQRQGHLAPRLRWLGLYLHFFRKRILKPKTFHLKSLLDTSVSLSKSCNRVNIQHSHVRWVYTLPYRHWIAIECCWQQGHLATRRRWLGLQLHFLRKRILEPQTFHLKSLIETSVSLSRSRNQVNIQHSHVQWLYTLPSRHWMALESCQRQGHLAPRLKWLGLHLHFLRKRTLEPQTFHLKSLVKTSVSLSKSCKRVNIQHSHVRWLYTLPSRHYMALESCQRQGHLPPRQRWLGLNLPVLRHRILEPQTFHLKSLIKTSVSLSKSCNRVNIQHSHVQWLCTQPYRHWIAIESCWRRGYLARRLRWLGLDLHFLRTRAFEPQSFHLKSLIETLV